MTKICMECGETNGFHQPGCQWHRDDRINDSVCYNGMAKRIAELEAENEKSLKGLGVLLNNWNRDVENLEAENEKFRAALTEIADHEPDCDCKTYQYCPCLSCTAKKALGRGMWAEKDSGSKS